MSLTFNFECLCVDHDVQKINAHNLYKKLKPSRHSIAGFKETQRSKVLLSNFTVRAKASNKVDSKFDQFFFPYAKYINQNINHTQIQVLNSDIHIVSTIIHYGIFLFQKLLLALWVKISNPILYEVNTHLCLWRVIRQIGKCQSLNFD